MCGGRPEPLPPHSQQRNMCDLMRYVLTMILVVVMTTPLTLAQQVIATPLRQILHLSPGEHLEGDIQLKNREDTTNIVEITCTDLNADDYEIPWIQLPTNTLTLAPLEETSIHYQIDVPEDAYGELCARFGYSVLPSKQQKGMLPIQTEINAPIYVIVEGRTDYSAEFSKLDVLSYDPFFVRGTIVHHGNAHVRSNPSVTITTLPDDTPIAQFALNDTPHVIYPHGKTNFFLGRNDTIQFEPGTYAAKLDIAFPDNEHRLSRTATFTVPEETPSDIPTDEEIHE